MLPAPSLSQRIMRFGFVQDPVSQDSFCYTSFLETGALVVIGVVAARSVLSLAHTRSVPGRGHDASQQVSRPDCECQAVAEPTPKTKGQKPVGTVQRKAKRGITKDTRLKEFLIQHARADDVKGLAQTLEDMEMLPSTSSMNDYALVIKHAARHAGPIVAHQWLKQAIEVGHVPDLATFHAVITSYAQQANIKQTVQVAKSMTDLGLEFNTTTYNLIIGAYARIGDAFSAQLWLKKLFVAKVHATAASFGLVLVSCASAGVADDLEEWFEVSQKVGVQLNQRWFSSVVSALAKGDKLGQAITWLERMVAHGVRPRADCTSALLHAVLSLGRTDLAALLLDRMRAAGIEPDGYCFSRCVAVAALVGDNALAEDWADECARCQCALSSGARRALIHAGLRIPDSPQSEKVHAVLEEEVTERQILHARPMQNSSGQPLPDLQARRKACLGKTFTGIIKEFRQGKFGFISCEDTFGPFQRDIYMGGSDNPDSLEKGRHVTFTLKVDPDVGLPRASDIKACEGSFPVQGVSCFISCASELVHSR